MRKQQLNWGVVAVFVDGHEHRHILPLVQLEDGGAPVASAAHIASGDCPCKPTMTPCYSDPAITVWNHYDPDHPGSKEREAAK